MEASMASQPQQSRVIGGGSFLVEDRASDEVFTPEQITDEQRMFARTAEEFLRKEVIPQEDRIYAKDYSVHRELMLKAGELGLLSIDIPEKYGGLGLNKVSSTVVGEQFALQSSFAGTQSSHVNIGTLPLVFFGTEEQKRKYLPKLASGEWIGAYALTEPQSGSDALAARQGLCFPKTGATTFSTVRRCGSRTAGSPTCSPCSRKSTVRSLRHSWSSVGRG
jgi:alkylation response protein AidB-like acyl-CoA dehydrogenase